MNATAQVPAHIKTFIYEQCNAPEDAIFEVFQKGNVFTINVASGMELHGKFKVNVRTGKFDRII